MPYNPDNFEDRERLAHEVTSMLEEANFSEIPVRRGQEQTFEFAVSQRPGMFITVYTSIVDGAVRAVARDAIRVSLVYKPKRERLRPRGVSKFIRVYRVGEIPEIVKRTHFRMRAAWTQGRHHPVCGACSAPLFTAKSGKPCCSELCWLPNDELSAGQPQQ